MRTVFVMIALLMLVWESDAHSYLDPGTGSYALQMIIAGIVSVFFSLKIFWRRIVVFFTNLFRGKK